MDEGSETTASSGAASLAWATQISHYKNYRRLHKPRVHGWLDFAIPKPLLHDVERRVFRQESPTVIGVSQPQFATTKGTIGRPTTRYLRGPADDQEIPIGCGPLVSK